MAKEVVMPALEMAQDTGTLVRWLKAEGEFVAQGEPLMEIETDKVTVEIEAPSAGWLSNITVQSGDEVPVGQVIALLLTDSEWASKRGHAIKPADATAGGGNKVVNISPVAQRLAAEHGLDLATIPVALPGNRLTKEDVLAYLQSQQSAEGNGAASRRLLPASPKARRLAGEQGIDLTTVQGSGPGGAVRVADVQARLAQQPKTQPAPVTSPLMAPSSITDYSIVPIRGKRKVIAQRLQASYQTAPHIALTLTVDMSETLRLCQRLGAAIQAESGHALTFTAIFAKVISATLRKHPRLNAHLVDDEIHEFSTVHLGVAVALDEGLVVPVLRHIEQKGLAALQGELNDLTQRARGNALRLDEIKGSTFTLSNLGMFGIEQFTAILNPPEVGILTIGVIKETPVGIEGRLELRPLIQLTLNADHRAVDGAVAAAFLKALKEAFENPYLLLK